MKTKDTLHDLVHCLNTSEKRQFKLYLKIYNQSKEGNVVRLFDAYNKMKEFCESELIANLKGDRILNNFSYEKHRLQKAITDFLVNKESSVNTLVELNHLFSQALVLRSKRQYLLATKALEKGMKIAEKYEENFHLALFLREELMLKSIRQDLTGRQEDNDKFLSVGGEIVTEIKYAHFRHEMSLFSNTERVSPSKDRKKTVEAILNNAVINDIEGATNFRAKNSLYFGRMYFYNIANFDKSIEESQAISDLLESNPLQLIREHRAYIGSQFFIAYYYMREHKYEAVLDSLSKIKEFKDKYIEYIEKRSIFELKGDMLSKLFHLFTFTGNIKAMICVFKEHRQFFKHHLTSINDIAGYYLLEMISSFYARNYSECLTWLNNLDKDESNTGGIGFVSSCKMISVMALYEQKEFILMRSQFNNLYYYSRNHNLLKMPFFKMSQKVLRKLSNEPETPFTAFEKTLKQLKEVYRPSPYGQNIFIMWLESKIEQVEFCHIVEKSKIPIDEKKWSHLLV